MDDREDDDEVEGAEDFPVYTNIDEETRAILEAALNCLVSLSQAQVSEESEQGILSIADSLAVRFGISRIEVEQEIHPTDDGDEEVIYRPKDSIFKSKLLDDDEEEQDSK